MTSHHILMSTFCATGHYLPAVGRLHQSVADLEDGQSNADDAANEGTRATTRAWLQRAFPMTVRAGGGQNGGTGDKCASLWLQQIR